MLEFDTNRETRRLMFEIEKTNEFELVTEMYAEARVFEHQQEKSLRSHILLSFYIDFLEIYTNIIDNNNKIQILDFLNIELAFLYVCLNIDFSKLFENSTNMLVMLLLDVTINKNVIQINNAKDIQFVSKNIVDEVLSSE